MPEDDSPLPRRRASFAEDFRRFFIRGLAALLPTLITLWLLFWVWNFLWDNIGRHIIWAIKWLWATLQEQGLLPDSLYRPAGRIRQILDEGQGYVVYVDGVPTSTGPAFRVKLLGVGLAILLVYVVGVFVGNLIGRTMWRLSERALMRLPLVRAIYPSVKQVTDFLLSDRQGQFKGAHVVAVQARAQGIWAIGLVTGSGVKALNQAIRGDMVTVFIPSSPTAVAGYVVVAHREAVIELPMTVEDALRLLVSGGVIAPGTTVRPGGGGSPTIAPANGAAEIVAREWGTLPTPADRPTAAERQAASTKTPEG